MVGGEKDGKITMTINGHSLHYHRDTNFWFETTFTLPAGTNPKQLHATINRCADGETIGKVVLAIYKIEDGTLTLAGIRTPDSPPEPPITFESENTMSGHIKLRKVQPQEKNAKLPTSKVAIVDTTQCQPSPGIGRVLELGTKHPVEMAKIVSGPDQFRTPIAFRNNSAGIRLVCWIDKSGERRLYLDLKPGESGEIGTYLSHPWVVTDEHGNALGLYYPDGQKRTVTLE